MAVFADLNVIDEHLYSKQPRTESELSNAAESASIVPPAVRSLASDASEAGLEKSCGLREKIHKLELQIRRLKLQV